MRSYTGALQTIDPWKALSLLGFKPKPNHSYISYPCPSCGATASLKQWGPKKNILYCPKCAKGGNIISLAMEVKKIVYEEAIKFLEKAVTPRKKLTTPFEKELELDYLDYLHQRGITEETAQDLHIGRPKGRGVFAGCIVFLCHDENGMRLGYFGIKMTEGRANQFFNPELYLYGLNRGGDDLILVDDMFECVRLIQDGQNAVCNFGTPFLSIEQIELLKGKTVKVKVNEAHKKEFAIQSVDWDFFHKFE